MNVTRLKPKMDKPRPQSSQPSGNTGYLREIPSRSENMDSSARLEVTDNMKLKVTSNGDGQRILSNQSYKPPLVHSSTTMRQWLQQVKVKMCWTRKETKNQLFCIFLQSGFPWLSLSLSQERKETTPSWTTRNVWIQFLLRGGKCVEQSRQHSSFVAINQWRRRHQK